MNQGAKARVLFVCMGNICRSPTAEGVFRQLVEEAGLADVIETDSAGTHSFHVGSPPDRRAREAAGRRGVTLDGIRSRAVTNEDFNRFDYILAMDRGNFDGLMAMASGEQVRRLHPFLDFATEHTAEEVPDPYYGSRGGFEHVLDLIEDASRGLLRRVRADHGI